MALWWLYGGYIFPLVVKPENLIFLIQIWHWRSKSIAPQNNRDLNQGILHLWSKFGDPSLNGWWVIALTNLVTDGRTDGQTQATIIPRGQNWPRVTKLRYMSFRRNNDVIITSCVRWVQTVRALLCLYVIRKSGYFGGSLLYWYWDNQVNAPVSVT